MDTNTEPSAFFPPLPSLLSGSSRLISFEAVHNAFSLDPEFVADSEALEKFCYDAQTFSLLSLCPDGLPKPSTKSKSEYEAKTAPIQVSGSQNGEYDLEQMKKDALELSAQIGVEESFALRLVVLEWQSRAEEQLLSGGGESGKSTKMSASIFGKGSNGLNGSVNGAVTPAVDFADETIRRRRQLQIYLKERNSRMRLGADLLGHAATRERLAESRTWMDDLSRQLFQERFKPDADASVADKVFDKAMMALNEQLEVLDDTSNLPKLAQESEETMIMYASATFNDIVTLMRIILVALFVRKDVPTSSMVTSWFQKLESLNYFLTLTPSPAWPDTSDLQCLIALISFTILDASAAISHLQDLESHSSGGVAYPHLNNTRYFEDEKCVADLNVILYRAALNNVSILTPAVFAWSLITKFVRDVAVMQANVREHMIGDGSSDNETLGRRRSSRKDSRDDFSVFERFYSNLQNIDMEPEAKENPPGWLATVASETVFDVIVQISASVSSYYVCGFDASMQLIGRKLLLRLLRESLSLTAYGGEILEAILAVLSSDTSTGGERRESIDSQLCSTFIQDDVFRREILDQALLRYPFELSPMLKLLASLASAQNAARDLFELLDKLQSITIMVPEHFNAYSLENEEENANEIRIEEDLPLFISRQALSRYGRNHVSRKALTMGTGEESGRGTNVTAIAAGTTATVLKESRPMVFKLDHTHSGLEYLGLLLSTRIPNSEMCVAWEQQQVDLSAAADIIVLTNALLAACLRQPLGDQDAQAVVRRMSDALPADSDIVNVVTELFESELLAHLDQSAQDGSLELLIACAELFALLLKIEPGRVWSALAHSSLLGFNDGTNALAAVVGATETAFGQFRFLSACSTIFANLVGDAIGGLIRRRPAVQPIKRGRFDSPIEKSEYTPERTMQRVLHIFTRVMLEAWESLSDWRFVVPGEKSKIAAQICSGFSTLLRATYGLQNAQSTSELVEQGNRGDDKRVASVLFPAADAILDFFAPRSGGNSSIRSFTTSFASAATVLSGVTFSGDRGTQIKQLEPMLDLLGMLLGVLREKDRNGKSAFSMANQLLKSTPDLTVIFTTEALLKAPVATLLTEMTVSLDSYDQQTDPPSLLSHLSTDTARSFLTVLSQLGRPLNDAETERQIWRFMNAVMRGRQQWITLYLLTGSLPKERLANGRNQTDGKGKSLLNYALSRCSRREYLTSERCDGLLEFISAAQGSSIWANTQVRGNLAFLNAVVDWLDGLGSFRKTGSTHEQTMRAIQIQNASRVCEILAQAVHASNEIGDQGLIKMLKDKLSFMSVHGQSVDAYNRSLHQKLNDNFRARFSGVEMEVFRRSAANPAEYGKHFAYDLKIMDRVLVQESAWSSSINQTNRANSFRDEACRANVNLSHLSSQTALLKGWSALATTLADSLGATEESVRQELSKTLATAVKNCLENNSSANIDVPGTSEVLMMRAEMSFVVMSRLTSGVPNAELNAVLPAAYRASQASPANFDLATDEEDLHYYRLILQVLFLAIQAHKHPPTRTSSTCEDGRRATDETHIPFLNPAVAGVLMDVVTKVIAPSWRALVGNLHTNIACALPSDFALLIALLQALLAVPGVSSIYTQIAEAVASMQLARSALSLYSWADQLAQAMDDDPVYGELAVQFLQILSTVRPVAEHLALQGTLPQLASANLSSYLRKQGGKGPFDEPKRMFSIWSEGMLPLCLNLLDAVGPPIAGEVSNFLNVFPLQLSRASIALENRDPTKYSPHAGAVTLGLVQEAHSLCLISMILASDTALAAAEGIDATSGLQGYDYKKVIEDGAGLVRQKASLASRIRAASPTEAAWAGRMVDGVDSVLSAKIFREVRGLAGLSEEESEADGKA